MATDKRSGAPGASDPDELPRTLTSVPSGNAAWNKELSPWYTVATSVASMVLQAVSAMALTPIRRRRSGRSISNCGPSVCGATAVRSAW
jgi:hypothetical protein